MEKISWKKLEADFNRYQNSELYTLQNAYNSASANKYRAWNYCKQLLKQNNGYNLKVIGFNCHMFSAGFEYIDGNGKKHFVKITKAHDYDAIVE